MALGQCDHGGVSVLPSLSCKTTSCWRVVVHPHELPLIRSILSLVKQCMSTPNTVVNNITTISTLASFFKNKQDRSLKEATLLGARNIAHSLLWPPKIGHTNTNSMAGTVRRKFQKISGKSPETLSELFPEFPSRVRPQSPVIQGILKPPGHLQSSLLSCTRLRVPPVALHVSRYTCCGWFPGFYSVFKLQV